MAKREWELRWAGTGMRLTEHGTYRPYLSFELTREPDRPVTSELTPREAQDAAERLLEWAARAYKANMNRSYFQGGRQA